MPGPVEPLWPRLAVESPGPAAVDFGKKELKDKDPGTDNSS